MSDVTTTDIVTLATAALAAIGAVGRLVSKWTKTSKDDVFFDRLSEASRTFVGRPPTPPQ